jgi:hypothetical protein
MLILSPSLEAISTSERLVSFYETARRNMSEIDRHGRMVNTPDSLSVSPGFKSRPGEQLS